MLQDELSLTPLETADAAEESPAVMQLEEIASRSSPPDLKCSLREQVEMLAAEWSLTNVDLQSLKAHYQALCDEDERLEQSQKRLDALCAGYHQATGTSGRPQRASASVESDDVGGTSSCAAHDAMDEEALHNTTVHTQLDRLEDLLSAYASHTRTLRELWDNTRAWHVALIDHLYFLPTPYPLLLSLYQRRDTLWPTQKSTECVRPATDTGVPDVTQHVAQLERELAARDDSRGDERRRLQDAELAREQLTQHVAELERELAARDDSRGDERRRLQDAELAREQLTQHVAELERELAAASATSESNMLARLESEKVALASRVAVLEEDMAVAAELSLEDTERIAVLETSLSETKKELEGCQRELTAIRAEVAAYDDHSETIATAKRELAVREGIMKGEVNALREALMLKERIVTRLEQRMHRAAAVEGRKLKRLRDVWAAAEGELLELPAPPSDDDVSRGDMSGELEQSTKTSVEPISADVASMLKREVHHLLRMSEEAMARDVYGV